MESVNKAIELAMSEYKKEFNEGLEDGDEFATVFNDGVLIVGLENRKLTLKILCGKPYMINHNLNLTE